MPLILFLAAVAGTSLRYAEFFEDDGQWAEFAEAVLKEVCPDKGGKEIPVGMHPGPKGQADQDKSTGENMHPVCDDH